MCCWHPPVTWHLLFELAQEDTEQTDTLEYIVKTIPKEKLKEAASKCNARKRTAMHVACEAGNVAMMEVLLDASPKAVNRRDADGDSPIDCAIAENHMDLVRKVSRCLLAAKFVLKFTSDDLTLRKATN